MFKTFNGLESSLPADFFHMDNARYAIRGHPFKITKMNSRLDLRKYSFTQRLLVNNWNQLTEASPRLQQLYV